MTIYSTDELIDDEQFFSQSPLFASVDPHSIAHYLRECSLLHIASGDALLTPQMENAFLYVLAAGRMEVRLDTPDRAPLITLKRGECVGEMSMIEQSNPSAYVIAAEDSAVLAISHDVLWAMVGASHAIARNLLVILSGRLRTDNEIIADSAVIIKHFQKKSFTDALTGLNNRRWMEDFFTREIARVQMNERLAVLAVIDIDHFRSFNNTFGHLVGDHGLGAVAEVLSEHFRADDLLARYGGDEFVALLPDLSSAEAMDVVERVRLALRKASDRLALTIEGCEGITASIGIAELKPDDTLRSLLSRADEALYRAKEKGRDCVSD